MRVWLGLCKLLMVGTMFVLVHAPGLGPTSWRPVADRLADAGHEVVVPDLTGFTDAGSPYAGRLIEFASAQVPADRPDGVTLVVHSGSGIFAPYLAAELRAPVVNVIFADAGVPPEAGRPRIVGSETLEFLRELARDGVVPPWPQWWPADTLAQVLPDADSQRVLSSDSSALPLAFYQEQLPPVPRSWSARRAAYLCFSESYQSEADEARRRGWLVRTLHGEHLHMLVDPAEVAAAIAEIAADLTQVPHRG